MLKNPWIVFLLLALAGGLVVFPAGATENVTADANDVGLPVLGVSSTGGACPAAGGSGGVFELIVPPGSSWKIRGPYGYLGPLGTKTDAPWVPIPGTSACINTDTCNAGYTVYLKGPDGAEKTFPVPSLAAESCHVIITYQEFQLSQVFPPEGGTGRIFVGTTAGTSWTATSQTSWISITAGTSGSADGICTFSVAPTTSSSARYGVLSINGELWSIMQEGAIPTPPNPVPVISGIEPESVVAGGPSFTLKVTGEQFRSESVIRWNGADLPTTYLSAEQLSAEIPSVEVATAGTASVTVFTPATGGGTSASLDFTITEAPPKEVVVITAETSTTSSYLAYSSSYLKQGQSMKAARSSISQIAVALAKKGTSPPALTLSVRSSLKGADLATATITASMVTSTDSANPTWVTVPLTAGDLTPGNTYYFILSAPSGDLKNYYWVPVNSQNPFKDGIHYKGTGLSDNPGSDMLVKVWFT